MFYNYITTKRNDSNELKKKIESTVQQLIVKKTDPDHPGMLLGLIQSGKTRAFIGVIALGFDKKYDICVVITKSSTALIQQTVKRITSEFEKPVQNGHLYVYDVMHLPPVLTPYMIGKKIIFVAKKEDDNLKKLNDVFFKQYNSLGKKNVLIIDDEADFASVTYHADKTKPDGVRFGVLAEMISGFRKRLGENSDFLQVTATPYSLYLQPKDIIINKDGYEPLRPAFTVVLDAHPMYVGGKIYFQDSQDSNSYASHLFQAVPASEFDKLTIQKSQRKPDDRIRQNILSTNQIIGFRNAFINYLVAGSIRSIQEINKLNDEIWSENYKSAYLIHVHTAQKSHKWQNDLITELINKLNNLIDTNSKMFSSLISSSYVEFTESIKKNGLKQPDFKQVLERVTSALKDGEISVKLVNSENSVVNLLNNDGQLRLDNPFNVFIGGQVLDRGITIDHLIAFYYGRNPGTFQMDTVLQHSRMYGARSKEDMSVTRLYTSSRIHKAMQEMHFFDNSLRECAQKGERVKFIQRRQDGTVKPCSPNKIVISSIVTIRPHSRHLPYGFQTISPSLLKNITTQIDSWITINGGSNAESGWLQNIDDVITILKKIETCYEYSARYNNEELKWDFIAFIDTLKYVSQGNNKVYILSRYDRDISRMKNNNSSWTDAPDDGNNDLAPAKALAIEYPALILIKQNGKKINGWLDAPFYWPVLVVPRNTQTSIYSEL
jgi:hypothetical protein